MVCGYERKTQYTEKLGELYSNLIPLTTYRAQL